MSDGLEISAGVSHAERQGGGSHFDDNRQDELRGVTTPPRGNGSKQCEVPTKTASDFILEDSQLQQLRTDSQLTREQESFRQMTEELLIGQTRKLLNQEELQDEAARAEAEAENDRLATIAKTEADRLATFARAEATAAKAEADRLATFAKAEAELLATLARTETARLTTLAKTEADRHLARERLLLRHRMDLLKLQQQHLHGNETNRSAIPENGGIKPMQRYRHDYVEYELGA